MSLNERDALTRELRALAARLDELDRDLADRAWPNTRRAASAPLQPDANLEAEHCELSAQLRTLAARLRQFDKNGI